jgi:hypothetical protein
VQVGGAGTSGLLQALPDSVSQVLPPPDPTILIHGTGFIYRNQAYQPLDLSAPTGTFRTGRATWVYVYQADTLWRYASTPARTAYAILSEARIAVSDVRSLDPGAADLRSNDLGADPNIQADSVDGATYSREGPASIAIAGGRGPEVYQAPALDLPDLPVQAIVRSWSQAGVDGTHPYGGPAEYRFDYNVLVTSPGPGRLAIDGIPIAAPATVYVGGRVSMSGGTLTLPQGIHFFVAGDLDANTSIQQETTSPETGGAAFGPPAAGNQFFVGGNVRSNGISGQGIHLLIGGAYTDYGISTRTGLLYVRGGPVTTIGQQDLVGLIVARNGGVVGPSLDLTFDPSVGEALDWLGLDFAARLLGPRGR